MHSQEVPSLNDQTAQIKSTTLPGSSKNQRCLVLVLHGSTKSSDFFFRDMSLVTEALVLHRACSVGRSPARAHGKKEST